MMTPENVFAGPSISKSLPATTLIVPVLTRSVWMELVPLLVAVISSVPALLSTEFGALPSVMVMPLTVRSNTS